MNETPDVEHVNSTPTDLARYNRDLDAIQVAVHRLGVRLRDVRVVAQGRTGVYRVVAHAVHQREQTPAGERLMAARVSAQSDSITAGECVHRVVHSLHDGGAPVAAPLHPDLVATPFADVGFWQWLNPAAVTARNWGVLTGTFHRSARAQLTAVSGVAVGIGRYDPAVVFGPRLRRARQLTSQPGHPLFGANVLVRSFEAALQEAVEAARAAAAGDAEWLVVHGDNQPGNVMATPRGGFVFNDFERLTLGPRAVDLAGLLLGVQHFGYPPSAVQDFLDGYGPGAPRLESVPAYARVRELSATIIAMICADQSPQMEEQMHVRATSISDPGAGPPWTYIGTPDAMRLADLTAEDRASTTHSDTPLSDIQRAE
jgi:phosphotransferase family enzyme